MSAFTLNSITGAGLGIISRLVAGSTLEFTRIAIGDGAMPSDKTPLTVTDLTNRLFDVDINSVESNGKGSATVSGIFNNEDKEVGFFYRELGLFAKDPATGKEVLYCYGNAAADAEWISPSGASSIIEKEVKITTLVGNAETVTAEIKSGIYATKEELAETTIRKADLDAPAAEGGRVLAEQMRFDTQQTLYVDAAAAEGGDGSETKPFKTIGAAVAAHYGGAGIIDVRIKPGNYPEDVTTPYSPGKSWLFGRNGSTGSVAVKSIFIDSCNYAQVNNIEFTPEAGKTAINIANVNSAVINQNVINSSSNGTGISISRSRAAIWYNTINNSGTAIIALSSSHVSTVSNAGTGNSIGVVADNSFISYPASNTLSAATLFQRNAGGGITAEGGGSSMPSNYAQLYNLGDFTDAESLKAAILAELGKLGMEESRQCYFSNNIESGFGEFTVGQHMQVTITKSTNDGAGYGTAFFKSHHNAAAGYIQIQDGRFVTETPIIFATAVNGIGPNENGNIELPIATTEKYGLVKIATAEEAIKQRNDAAVSPATYHDISDFRHQETTYSTGDKVGCMFNHELFLECTKGGTTSADPLDTRNVTHGQIITDGTAEWTVRTHIKSINGVVAGADGDINVMSLVSTEIPVNADLNNYKEAGMYTCHLDATAATILNAPSPNAFFLEVRTMTDCLMQLYTAFPFNLSMHVRLYYAGNGWGAWKEIAMFNTAGHLLMPNGAEFWIA